jgi:hypothetical protein
MALHLASQVRCRASVSELAKSGSDSSRCLQNTFVLFRREIDLPSTSEPALQRLMDANVNTVCNSAFETIMDGGGERQQHSGDCSHQLHAVQVVFGETRLVRLGAQNVHKTVKCCVHKIPALAV